MVYWGGFALALIPLAVAHGVLLMRWRNAEARAEKLAAQLRQLQATFEQRRARAVARV